MKLWIDDVRPAPEGYVWVKSVSEAKEIIIFCENPNIWPSYNPFKHGKKYEPIEIELLDIDHDAGDYGPPDYIKVLDWLEATGRNYPIRIHSMNPVGVANMRAIIKRNGWTEVK